MVTDDTLRNHMAACELTYALMLDENRLLNTTGAPPGDDFMGQKRVALQQLENTLIMLRSFAIPSPAFLQSNAPFSKRRSRLYLRLFCSTARMSNCSSSASWRVQLRPTCGRR